MSTTEQIGISSADGQRSVAVVAVADLPQVWPRALDVIREHKQGLLDRFTEEDVYTDLASSQWQLWVGVADGEIDLVGITRVETYKHETVFRLLYVGGELMKFMPSALEVIEHFASFIGADYVAYDTRESVVRLLRKWNYYVHTYEMRKNVKILWRSSYGG